MKDKKAALVLSAIELTSVGEKMEAAREKLKQLADAGTPYESEEMKKALREFLSLEQQWKLLEQEHLALKNKL